MNTRHLLSNAQNGNFEAAVQVFLNYRDGAQNFEKSEEQAQIAFENVIKILEKNFYINEIHISNFKKIHELKLDLHKNLTVFIGKNGTGKTSLLRAIQKNLSWFSAFILKENTNGERIVDSEINNLAKDKGDSACLKCSFKIGAENRIDGQLIREPKGTTTDLKTEVTEYRKFGKNIRELLAFQNMNLPLLVFYDIERFKRNDFKKLSNQENLFFQLDGYEKSSNSRVSFEIFIEWLIKILKISNKNFDLVERDRISSQIDILLNAGANKEDSPLNGLYKDLLSSLNSFPNDAVKSKSKKIVEDLEGLFRSIYPKLLNIELINDDDGEDKIAINLGNEIIYFHQFSDGQRVLFGLIGDIARRLILLNPNMDSPFDGTGIILIDEIELHLHPKWQQKIILLLQKKFKNIQFVITTHSPHVLSTVDKSSIYIISTNQKIEHPIFQTKGVASSDILECIMGTYSEPEIYETKKIKEYLSLIKNNSYKTENGEEIYSELINHFGVDHPIIDDIKTQIKISELRSKFRKGD